MKTNQIKHFERVFNQLDKKRYNSIQLEFKRNFSIRKKIKIRDQYQSWNLVINYISPIDKIESAYFSIKNKVRKIVGYTEFSKIEFQ